MIQRRTLPRVTNLAFRMGNSCVPEPETLKPFFSSYNVTEGKPEP